MASSNARRSQARPHGPHESWSKLASRSFSYSFPPSSSCLGWLHSKSSHSCGQVASDCAWSGVGTCLCVCVYLCIYICIYTYFYLSNYLCTYWHIDIYSFTFICIITFFAYIYTYMYTDVCPCISKRGRMCIRTRTCMCKCLCVSATRAHGLMHTRVVQVPALQGLAWFASRVQMPATECICLCARACPWPHCGLNKQETHMQPTQARHDGCIIAYIKKIYIYYIYI